MHKGESIRVFPLSNWTELDIWHYIMLEGLDIVPLYFAAERPVVTRDGLLIVVHDERMRLHPGETPEQRMVRFRSLGCYPLTAAHRIGRGKLARDRRRDVHRADFGARRTADRQGRKRLDGKEEARGVFLT